MKPFGKWLADFELPPKDEPEPQIEVVVNQGELLAPSVDDFSNAPCGIMASSGRRYSVDFATGTVQLIGELPITHMAEEFKITIGASETQCTEHVVSRELYELFGCRPHLNNEEWLSIVNIQWDGILQGKVRLSELADIFGKTFPAIFVGDDPDGKVSYE